MVFSDEGGDGHFFSLLTSEKLRVISGILLMVLYLLRLESDVEPSRLDLMWLSGPEKESDRARTAPVSNLGLQLPEHGDHGAIITSGVNHSTDDTNYIIWVNRLEVSPHRRNCQVYGQRMQQSRSSSPSLMKIRHHWCAEFIKHSSQLNTNCFGDSSSLNCSESIQRCNNTWQWHTHGDMWSYESDKKWRRIADSVEGSSAGRLRCFFPAFFSRNRRSDWESRTEKRTAEDERLHA